jgi:hypothetical protein
MATANSEHDLVTGDSDCSEFERCLTKRDNVLTNRDRPLANRDAVPAGRRSGLDRGGIVACRLLYSALNMTINNRHIAAALLAAAATFAPVAAHATVAIAVPFDQKVDSADAIVLGKCVQTRSQYDPTGRWILTYSTFQVEKAMKGQAQQEITVVTPGGEVGGIRQSTVGVPEFERGREQVLFVRGTRLGPTVADFDQGAYDVLSDSGQRIVRPVPSGAMRMDEQRGTVVEAEQAQPLATFEGSVRQALDRNAKNRMALIEKRKQEQQSSISEVVKRNKLLIALALAGVALATWQLLRRG